MDGVNPISPGVKDLSNRGTFYIEGRVAQTSPFVSHPAALSAAIDCASVAQTPGRAARILVGARSIDWHFLGKRTTASVELRCPGVFFVVNIQPDNR
jgi:hypothetical protein